MRIFIGGAYNGKRDYVRNMLANEDVQWFEGALPTDVGTRYSHSSQTTVIAGIEKWLAETTLSEAAASDAVMSAVAGRDVVVILTDIGRGIVPIDAEQRQLRDACGRLYQRLIAEADEVTRIWYGLAQSLI